MMALSRAGLDVFAPSADVLREGNKFKKQGKILQR